MSATGTTWSYVGNLPKAAFGMSGVTVNNRIFVTGEQHYKLKKNDKTKQKIWNKVDMEMDI